ncbi:uncharacterized protein BDV14DRAFT_199795 [Aspergillus stella-maris]|uniref:uncharacterized protein n=1 Tax=Aspergillus stella-maris TaxID=1810926 RepID=UPI003CCCBE8F
MSSCSYIRLHMWFYYQATMHRLQDHLEKKEDEQFRRMLKQHKKLGYDRRDKPSPNDAPETWDLTFTGDRRAVKQWAVDSRLTSLRCGGYKRDYEFGSDLARYFEWTQYQKYSIIQHPARLFIQPRLEILLYTVLSEVQKQARIKSNQTWTQAYKLSLKGEQDLTCNRDEHPFQPCNRDPGIDLATERDFFMPFIRNGKECKVEGKINHVVFSGDESELDATFVVLRARKKNRVKVWDLVKVMGMIHHARKRCGKESAIYGLATDSYEFAFAHIDEKCRYSTWHLKWEKNSTEIISQLIKIFFYAGVRAKKASKEQTLNGIKHTARTIIASTTGAAMKENKSVSQKTLGRLYRREERIYSPLDLGDNPLDGYRGY